VTSDVGAEAWRREVWVREEQQIVFALMMTFSVIVVQILSNRPPQRKSTKEDEFGQTLALDGTISQLTTSVFGLCGKLN
jgi:hypothetical protein